MGKREIRRRPPKPAVYSVFVTRFALRLTRLHRGVHRGVHHECIRTTCVHAIK